MIDRETEFKIQRKAELKERLVLGDMMPISAQEDARMTVEDKQLLKEAFEEEGKDYEKYLEKSKLGWPARTEPKPIRWRDGKSGNYLS